MGKRTLVAVMEMIEMIGSAKTKKRSVISSAVRAALKTALDADLRLTPPHLIKPADMDSKGHDGIILELQDVES